MTSIIGLKSNVFLAPMAGITDRPFRKAVAATGTANLYSEMVAVNAINRKNAKTYRIADVREEPYPVIVQLVGNDPLLFAEAAKLAADLGAYSIDINMGCPVKKIVANDSGAALMKDLTRASKIIESTVRATSLKVSVKFRKGWDNALINAPQFAKMCEDSGASFVTVHGRTRAQGYSGAADWDIIRQVKETISIPVIGNGDVTSPQKAEELVRQTGCDGIMIARGAEGNPWIFSEMIAYEETGVVPPRPDKDAVREMMLRHARLQLQYKGEYCGIREMRKHVAWYTKGLKGAARLREKVNEVESLEELENLLTSL